MTLLGNRILIKPVKKEEQGGIILPDSVGSIDQKYVITHVGEDAELDGRVTEGSVVIVSDAIVNRSPEFTINETAHRLITPDNIIGLP